MKMVIALLSALAGIISSLPFLLRAWQDRQRRLSRQRQLQEIHDAVYSGDRDRLAALLERLRQASAQAISNPPTGWNRAGYIGMLMGAPLGMGGATALATNPTLGTAAGLGTAAALWNALSRKPIKPSTAAMIERLTAGTTNAGLARMFGQ